MRPRPGKPGVIDEELIQGAKDTRGFVQFRQDSVERCFPGLDPTHAEEMELDAFGESTRVVVNISSTDHPDYQDLELLSRSDRTSCLGMSTAGNAGRHLAAHQPESMRENPPIQTSHFFNRKYIRHVHGLD